MESFSQQRGQGRTILRTHVEEEVVHELVLELVVGCRFVIQERPWLRTLYWIVGQKAALAWSV